MLENNIIFILIMGLFLVNLLLFIIQVLSFISIANKKNVYKWSAAIQENKITLEAA